MKSMKTVGVVLAAGASQRMGQPKALLRDASGATFLERVGRTLRAGGCDLVLAVVGRHAGAIAASLPEDLLLVANPRWRDGQLSSARAGLRAALAAGAERVVLHPVDQPRILPRDVRAVLAACGPRTVACAAYRGLAGHPVAFSRAVAAAVLENSSAESLRDALGAATTRKRNVAGSSGCIQGANTPQELARLWAGPGKRREETP